MWLCRHQSLSLCVVANRKHLAEYEISGARRCLVEVLALLECYVGLALISDYSGKPTDHIFEGQAVLRDESDRLSRNIRK